MLGLVHNRSKVVSMTGLKDYAFMAIYYPRSQRPPGVKRLLEYTLDKSGSGIEVIERLTPDALKHAEAPLFCISS